MGKEELTYISQNTCIDLLNKAFNYMWSFVIDEQWMEPGVPLVKKENPKWPFNEKNTESIRISYFDGNSLRLRSTIKPQS